MSDPVLVIGDTAANKIDKNNYISRTYIPVIQMHDIALKKNKNKKTSKKKVVERWIQDGGMRECVSLIPKKKKVS